MCIKYFDDVKVFEMVFPNCCTKFGKVLLCNNVTQDRNSFQGINNLRFSKPSIFLPIKDILVS